MPPLMELIFSRKLDALRSAFKAGVSPNEKDEHAAARSHWPPRAAIRTW